MKIETLDGVVTRDGAPIARLSVDVEGQPTVHSARALSAALRGRINRALCDEAEFVVEAPEPEPVKDPALGSKTPAWLAWLSQHDPLAFQQLSPAVRRHSYSFE